ncbi:hypothetical protein FHL15_004722 [Xylaria flabelliformis]|uniref:Uncharacterized protein n=1 Tax=Xylaria flabelliformis TaxID=2512241 RepID=A0A553I227_9PEZI|nr:hypothetical protein FHL15_004722 [Xylaria flabelliformis]
MAQQGGTYRLEAASAVHVPSESSSRPRHQNCDSKDNLIPGVEKGGDDTRTQGGLTASDHALKLANTPRESRDQANGENEDQDWEVVQHLDAETGENPHDPEVITTSHFDITLSWRRHKLTIFSWDMSIRTQGGDGSQSSLRNGR